LWRAFASHRPCQVDLNGSEQSPEQQHRRGSAEGSLRLDPSIELLVQLLDGAWWDGRWLGGSRVEVKSRSPASCRLPTTVRCLSRHLRMKALRRVSILSRDAA